MVELNEVEKHLAFEKFEAALPDLIEKAEHSELYGYDLTKIEESENEGKVIKEQFLKKFLKANDYSLEESKTQLLNTLKWRKEFNPLSAAFKEEHKSVLNDTGIVTLSEYERNGSTQKRVTTWNLYGAVSDRHQLFGDLDAFLRWRVGLMEQGMTLCDFTDEETSYMSQIHDYYNVSFLRLDKETREASRKAIHTFQSYYPESLDYKYFVNVPRIMSWIYYVLKPVIAKETFEKFVVLDNGNKLAAKLGDWTPAKQYGGKGEPLAVQQQKDVKPRNQELVDEQYKRHIAQSTDGESNAQKNETVEPSAESEEKAAAPEEQASAPVEQEAAETQSKAAEEVPVAAAVEQVSA